MSDEYIKNLNAERQKVAAENRDLLTLATTENRLMSAEEDGQWKVRNERIDELAAQIKDFSDRVAAEREADIARAANADIVRPVDHGNRAEQEDEFIQFLRGKREGNVDGQRNAWDIDFTHVAREKALIRQGADVRELREQRILTVGTGAAGGTTVPTDLVRVLYDYLENVSGVRQAGATVITTSAGNNIDLPTVTAHGTAAIVGEGTALAAADPAFGKITLGAYKFGQLAQISHELLQDTGVDLSGFLGADFGRGLGRVTETNYVRGSGSNAPQGACLAATVGTGVTLQTVATGVPSYANLVSLVYDIEDIYRNRGACWLMQDAFAGVIRKLTDTTGQPLWQPGFVYGLKAGTPDTLLGFPIYTTPFLSAVGTAAGTPMAFGNFGMGYVIRDAGSVRIERSDDYAFNTDLVTFRAILRTDAKVRDARAISVALAPTT